MVAPLQLKGKVPNLSEDFHDEEIYIQVSSLKSE